MANRSRSAQDNEQKVLEACVRYARRFINGPPYRWLVEDTGLSLASVRYHIEKLAKTSALEITTDDRDNAKNMIVVNEIRKRLAERLGLLTAIDNLAKQIDELLPELEAKPAATLEVIKALRAGFENWLCVTGWNRATVTFEVKPEDAAKLWDFFNMMDDINHAES